jgi:hypothetical protein
VGGKGGFPAKYTQLKCGLELYNLKTDIGESVNVATKHPDVVKQLSQYADEIRIELGDQFKKQKGNATREPGRI